MLSDSIFTEKINKRTVPNKLAQVRFFSQKYISAHVRLFGTQKYIGKHNKKNHPPKKICETFDHVRRI